MAAVMIVVAAAFTVVACEGPTGPEGPAGAQGPQGPQGTMGSVGVSGYEIVTRTGPIAGELTVQVPCPAGKKAFSGGYSFSGPRPESGRAPASYPSSDNTWTFLLENGYINPQTYTVYAVCASAT